MMKRLFGGIDPDLVKLPVATLEVDEDNKVTGIHIELIGVSHPPKDRAAKVTLMCQLINEHLETHTMNPCAAAVESQDVRYTGRTNHGNPQDLIYLAQVAGAAATLVGATHKLYMPLPSEWKGTIKKRNSQRRILDRLGIEHFFMGGDDPKKQYPVPVNHKELCKQANKSDWQDINDSLGLAFYAWDRWMKEGLG